MLRRAGGDEVLEETLEGEGGRRRVAVEELGELWDRSVADGAASMDVMRKHILLLFLLFVLLLLFEWLGGWGVLRVMDTAAAVCCCCV